MGPGSAEESGEGRAQVRIDPGLPQRIATQQAEQLARAEHADDLRALDEPRASAPPSETTDEARSSVRISAAAILASRIAKAIGQRPAFRTELVERLRERMASGAYQPDPARTARAMVDTITGRTV